MNHVSAFHRAIIRCAAVLLSVAAALVPKSVQAQTDGVMSQYYEVRNLYNPAMVGTTDSIRIRAGGRMQWVGIDNAPRLFAVAAESPFKLADQRLGAGLVVLNETYGLYASNQAALQLAFKLKKLGGEFSFALQGGLFSQRFKGSEVYLPDDDDYHEGTDDGIPMRDISGQSLDVAAGVAYVRPRWYAALSCTHLTNPTITLQSENNASETSNTTYEFQAKRTLYFMAGCNIPIKNTLIELMPSMLLRSDFAFTTGEVTLRARYHKMFSAGIGYRYDDAVYLTLGAEIKNFYIGYSYDYSTSYIARASSGSHELWLGYSFQLDLRDKNKYRHKSVRIM